MNDGTIGYETSPIISFTKSRWNADKGRCLEDDEDEKRDKKSGTHLIKVRKKIRNARTFGNLVCTGWMSSYGENLWTEPLGVFNCHELSITFYCE
jgi:hypothetical protein